MSDESLSATPELATATPAAVEHTPETEPENLQAPANGQGETVVEDLGQPDDFEEIDWSGKKFKAPKGLKDGLLMHADYTRKTQEVSEGRKALEAERARIDQQRQATEEELDIRAGLRHTTSEMKRLEGFGWAEYMQLRATDPVQADEIWNYKGHLQQQKTEAETLLGEKQTQRTQETQREAAKRIEETLTFARSLPGMTQEIHKENLAFARAKGVDDNLLAQNFSPLVYEMIHLARIGTQVLEKQKAPPKAPATTPAPLETVGGKVTPGARKTLAEMDMEEYVAARRAGRKG
jgi:hypothetical protein